MPTAAQQATSRPNVPDVSGREATKVTSPFRWTWTQDSTNAITADGAEWQTTEAESMADERQEIRWWTSPPKETGQAPDNSPGRHRCPQRPQKPANETPLTPVQLKWLADERHISAHAAEQLHITSSVQYMPQSGLEEPCLCFNYLEEGRLVNIKFRATLHKHFKMLTGAELIPTTSTASKAPRNVSSPKESWMQPPLSRQGALT